MCGCSLLLSPTKPSLGSAVISPKHSRRERSCVERHHNLEGINRWRCAEKEIAKVNDTEKLARLMHNYNDGWTQMARLETPIKAITSRRLFVRSGEPGPLFKCQAIRRTPTPAVGSDWDAPRSTPHHDGIKRVCTAERRVKLLINNNL